jgi:hypothetical protein
MPTEITPNSTKFYSQFRNGDSFTDNLSDFTPNLAAVVGEKVKLIQQIDIEWFFQATTSNPVDWEFLSGTTFRFKKTNGGWFGDDGFITNDNLDWSFDSGGTTYTTNGDVTNLSQTWMTVQFASVPTPLVGVTSQNSSTGLFRGLTDLTALIYKYGLIENNESFNTISKVTQHDQSYYCSGMTEGGGTVTFIPQGTYQDWRTGSGTCERLTNPSDYVQRFEIIHEFIMTPYYIDGELSNLQDDVLPALYDNNQSLKYAFRTEFRLTLSYVGSAKTAIIDDVPGSVGWFNQNFNGFANDYAITDIDYKDDLSNSADGILATGNSVITVTINKISGALVSTDKVGAIVSYLPESADYQDKSTTLTDNFMYDNNYCLADGVPVIGTGVITSTSAVISGGDIILTINTTYSTPQQTILAGKTDPNFLLAINIGDITITNGNSDRVMLIGDAEIYETNADIPDLMTLVDFRYFAHDDNIGVDPGWTTLTAWNEDNFAATFEFTVDTNKSAFVNSIELKLVALNPLTGNFFDLDSFFIDISGATVSLGVQQLEFTGTRGYNLVSGSQFNDVTLTTGANVGGVVTYTGTFSQKISWQDWIKNLDADTVFYDNTKPQDNRNYKSSNYSGISNYQINCGIVANVSGVSTLGIAGDTDYALLGGKITTNDYDEDGLVTPIWSGVTETFTEDGVTNLGGAIQTNGDNTLFKETWTNSVAPVVSIPNYWGIHRIEKTNQQGYNIDELSSIRNRAATNLLKPEAGLLWLDLNVVSGDIVATGLIDGAFVQGSTSYNLSSRIQSPNKMASVDLINFRTESLTPDTFNPTITKSGTTATWNYGDGSALDVTNSPSHVYSVPKEKTGYIEVDSFANVSGLSMIDDDINDILDLTDLIAITTVEIEDNLVLDGILNPTHNIATVKYSVKNSPLITSLDVSGLTKLGAIFSFNDCTALTTVTNGVSNELFTEYNGWDCDLTGILDVSGYTRLGGSFAVNGNANLTDIVIPSSSETFTYFWAFDTSCGYLNFTQIPNMTEINNCHIALGNMSGTTVTDINHMLVDLDTNSTGAFTGRAIFMDGTNPAPDGSSGGYDGLTAKANLIAKGFTVTTN